MDKKDVKIDFSTEIDSSKVFGLATAPLDVLRFHVDGTIHTVLQLLDAKKSKGKFTVLIKFEGEI